ncbi:MAG: M1 family metallopeptidase, partial [Acidobacteria bacterium]|nr:M1 family metallopeptidase [Acidobacteriota bacterium]
IDRAAPLPGALSPRNANYSIDVRLDHASRTLTGREVITWRNVSTRATSELRFHLYYNAFKNARSTWMRERRLAGRVRTASVSPDDWGWIEVSAVRLLTGETTPVDLSSQRAYIAPDDGNREDQTVLQVPLPAPIQPGETVNVEVSWNSKIPHTFSRTGAIGSYYFVAQWFPKIGVLEDTGWNCHQFHAGTEFYADYGVYDVRMTVPKAWVLGASGRERTRRDNADNTSTFTYHAEDVHDFAWTVSPDYIERRARFEHPTLPAVEMRLLLQPEHAAQADRHFEATRTALRYYGEWFGAYPYGHITIIDPAWQSGAGGMEYPTLFTAGSRWMAPARVTQPEHVTVHEAGHQFWYAIVGNNEFEQAWLDEGFNTFSTARAIEANPADRVNYYARRYFGGFVPYVFRDIPLSREVDGNGLSGYRASAKSDALSTPSYEYFPATGGGLSYDKTALWLHTLERYLGWPTLRRVMATHFDRWKFRHPKPEDFFATLNEVSGRDMTWFVDQVYRSSNVFDYGVESISVEPARGPGYVDHNGKIELEPTGDPASLTRSTVIVRRYGEAVFPVDVLVRFTNGEKVRERWNGRDRWTAFSYERKAGVADVVVDPDQVLLLDINRTNNSCTTVPMAAPAARKWSLKWMLWLQDALATYGFFV